MNANYLSHSAEARAYREAQDKKAVMERLARVQRLEEWRDFIRSAATLAAIVSVIAWLWWVG
jgi:hypothetical protein